MTEAPRAVNKPRLTIADIAREVGVSPSAVSFALNGRPGVSEADPGPHPASGRAR